jgi:coenzyme F420-0:L-glutamate ligase/coenzyme F420-1:gamma-L-glutamate ligase
MSITVSAVPDIPNVQPNDNVGQLILAAMQKNGMTFEDGDVLVIAQKIVSKAENRVIDIEDVTPTAKAIEIAAEVNKDPRKVQVVLDESAAVVRIKKHPNQNEGIIITRHRLGFISANAAVDESNTARPGQLLLLPIDPDLSARQIAEELKSQTGKRIGVIISDTFGRPWRHGQVNVAIGLGGFPAFIDWEGKADAYGRELRVTRPAIADEVAAASGLLMIKDARLPVILFRGIDWQTSNHRITDIIRPQEEDLFL